jgi:hypothetical protein
MSTANHKPPVQRLVAIDRKIDKSETTALRARWEFGKLMLAERKGKQLPKGMLDELAEATGKSRQELGYRMRFAERYPTEDELANALATFTSWRELTQSFSPGHDTDKEKPRATAAGRRLANDAGFLRTAVAEGLRPEDVDGIRENLLTAKVDRGSVGGP